jgi:hypothetical protein
MLVAPARRVNGGDNCGAAPGTLSDCMSALPTRQLFKLHRYAGLISAPLILFFALSGIWQVFRLHDDKKNGYKAPAVFKAGSDFHMAEGLRKGPSATAFRTTITAASAVLAFTALIGIILGFRTTRPRIVIVLLAAGAAVPLVLYLLARSS